MKKLKSLKLGKRLVSLHLVILSSCLALAVLLTLGYRVSCSSYEDHVRKILHSKLSKDPLELRGETVDERFTEDVMFWRYVQVIGSPFGAPQHSIQTSCRTLFTDPDIASASQESCG